MSKPFDTKENEKSTVGLRFNEGKLRWDLVDLDDLETMVRVLEYGAKKYTDHNWKKGGPSLTKDEILNSLQRHVNAMRRGERLDPESGLPHIAHILCNAMFQAHFERQSPYVVKSDMSLLEIFKEDYYNDHGYYPGAEEITRWRMSAFNDTLIQSKD
jgi:Domain of unknown function (DUF5664)